MAVGLPLALLVLPAWGLLALGSGGFALPALCSSELLWSVPSPESFAFFFAYVPPLSLALGWALMVAAMMLPTLADTLGHVCARSFVRLRPWLVALVISGYGLTWLLAGAVFLSLALGLRLASGGSTWPFLTALAVAALWQVSPWKQAALNRCHRRPLVAAFAPHALGDALRLGMSNGGWCLATCWPLMMVSLLAPSHHFATMALVSLYIWAERLDPPRAPDWRLRLPLRALRLARRAL